MIVNVFSTPRTGSIWFTHLVFDELKATHPSAFSSYELFNPFHVGMYRKLQNGKLMNVHGEYPAGAYYDYPVERDGVIINTKIYQPHNLLSDDAKDAELLRRLNLLRSADLSKGAVFQNHVYPIYEPALQWLKKNATKNYYVYRKDVKAQLSSYAVALATKVFIAFNKLPEIQENLTAPEVSLRMLADRIKVWRSLDKSDGTVIAYEDLPFEKDKTGFPKKQNEKSSFDKLSPETQAVILELEDKLREA